MRKAFLALLTLLGAAPLGFAQQYYGNPYYYARPPVQQTQYPYANYGYAPAPYGYQPSVPNGAYGYNNGYGVNYYYVNNPYAPNPYAAGAANPYAATADPVPSAGPSWPAPVQASPPLPAHEEDPVTDDAPAAAPSPGLNFRRSTTECFWFNAGYAAVFNRPMHMNGPLVNTGSSGDPLPGANGQPGTLTLFGDHSVDFGLFNGIRAELGLFLDHDNRFSLDLAGFYLVSNTQSFFIAGDPGGNPVISRPYFNVANTTESRFTNSQPGLLTGTIAVDLKSQMAGLEFNGRFHCYVQDRYHFDFLGGFRYVRLSESMTIREQVNPLTGSNLPFAGSTVTAPNFITDEDGFRTTNQFIGPQIGARLTWEERWFTLAGFAKVGLGATIEHTDIGGTTNLVTPTGATTANGGVLALPSNSGSFNRAVFGVLPEFGFDLGVNVCQNVRVKLGYSILLWNHVVRPGSQYDTNLNPSQVNSSFFFGNASGPSSPAHRFNEEFFFSHSFNLGVEVHF